MALSYVVGNTLVDADEFTGRLRDPDAEVIAFRDALRSYVGSSLQSPATLHFSTGRVTLDAFRATSFRDAAAPFEPVGIGKPATILLRHVYTGRFGKKDMLLTSAVRDPFTTFNMAPRAINLMPKRIPKKAHIQGPAATENGTELVYYIPALTEKALTMTIDMAFDDFPDELVDRIAGTISAAGSIPVFGPYSGVLLGVGAAIKLLAKFANSLVDSRAEFTVTERLDFQVPGSPLPISGYKVVSTNTKPRRLHFRSR